MRLLTCLAVISLLLITPQSWGYPEGAPPRHSGGFGEADCSQCHFGGRDSPEATLTLHDFDDLRAGAETTLELQLSASYAEVAGFQLTVRDLNGKQLGSFVSQPQQATGSADGVTYLTHSAPMTASDGKVLWPIAWQAPEALPEVLVVHASAVAGNQDQSPLGDSVLVLEQRVKVSD